MAITIDEVYSLIKFGEVEKLKEYLSTFTINGVNDKKKLDTFAFYAVNFRNVECLKVILDAGAFPADGMAYHKEFVSRIYMYAFERSCNDVTDYLIRARLFVPDPKEPGGKNEGNC